MSAGLPLIAVTGATGVQGGSVVRFLLEDGGFRIRAITRNSSSEKAKGAPVVGFSNVTVYSKHRTELASKGVDVVKADLDDFESLKKAVEGAYGVFGLTNFWEPGIGSRETQHGKNLVDAAKAAGVKHFVWSTLSRTNDPVCAHWNSKADVDDYLKASGVPRTSLYTVSYYENFTTVVRIKEEHGKLIADWPFFKSDGPIGSYAAAETGIYVVEALKNPTKWINKDIKVISDIITPKDVVAVTSEYAEKSIYLKEVSAEEFSTVKDVPELHEYWANNEWFYKHAGNPGHDFAITKEINPKVQTFREWAATNYKAILP